MNSSSNIDAIAARVAREKAAHGDSHIDDALRRWRAAFPHTFDNPAMKRLSDFYASELGSLRNKFVLEFGCGQGDFALWLLNQGATVFGVDISEFNVKRCEDKANARRFERNRYSFAVMNAHATAFPDKFFDLVVGNGILHHLELSAAMTEIARVLKPGAKALFQEPLGENPLLRLYRAIARIHTVDERPLTGQDLRYLAEQWNMKAKYSGIVTFPVSLLTSIILRPYPTNWLLQVATLLEDQLNRHHVLEHWNRFGVFIYERSVPDVKNSASGGV